MCDVNFLIFSLNFLINICYSVKAFILIITNVKPYSNTPLREQVANTVQVNYFGTLNVSNALFPLLRSNARVVNVVSDWGI